MVTSCCQKVKVPKLHNSLRWRGQKSLRWNTNDAYLGSDTMNFQRITMRHALRGGVAAFSGPWGIWSHRAVSR
jgi:hypothetical protein